LSLRQHFAALARDDPKIDIGVDLFADAFDVGVGEDVVDDAAGVLAARTPEAARRDVGIGE